MIGRKKDVENKKLFLVSEKKRNALGSRYGKKTDLKYINVNPRSVKKAAFYVDSCVIPN